jgi:nicotinamide-nucleotide amidase
MASFINAEQEGLVQQIAERLIDRGETVAVAESTTGGLLSAALLWVPGASRYYAGGGVVYTLSSRVALAGISPEGVANYRGTTPEMLASVAKSMRNRLSATWCLAESGLAGPTPGRSGAPPGRTTVSVDGPVTRTEVFETGITDRETNMVEFTTLALRLLNQVLSDAGETAKT